MSAVSSTLQRLPSSAHAPTTPLPPEMAAVQGDQDAAATELSVDLSPPVGPAPCLPLGPVTFHVATRGPAAAVAAMLEPAELGALAGTSRDGREVWRAELSRRITDKLMRGWQGLYEAQVAGLQAGDPDLAVRLNRIGEFAQAELLVRSVSSPVPVPAVQRLPVLIHSRVHAGNARGALALAPSLDRAIPITQAELVKAAVLEGLAFEAGLALQRALTFRPPLEAMLKHLEGRTLDAKADLDQAAARGVAYGTHWVELAQAYGQIGDWQGALRSFARAIRAGEPAAVGLPFSAMWRPIHANPNVARIVHRAEQLAASKFVRCRVAAATGITPLDVPPDTR